MRKVIIEARLNEYAMRDPNPNVPWTAAEIAASARDCLAAGATLIHFHAREADGRPTHGYDAYRDVMTSLRQTSDMMIHPTLGTQMSQADPKDRISHILRLAADGLHPDFAPLDMGTSNIDMFDAENHRFRTEDSIYLNTTGTLRYFANRLREAGVTPYPQVWNIPQLRHLAAFVESGDLTPPLFFALAMSEGGFLSTHPGTPAGLRAYFDFLPQGVPMHWSTAIFQGNLLPMIPQIVEAGGNISIGIGDYPYPELDYPGNAALIAEVALRVRACGAEVATLAEARALLGRAPLTA